MIVDSTLLITGGQAPVLLQPVDQPFHSFPGAVDGPIKGAFPALVALPWDGDADTMLPAIVPDRATAIALVAHDAVGTAFGPPAPRPLDGSLAHQLGKDRRLMSMARRQDECHELAVAFGTDVDFGTEATLTPAKRFGSGVSCVCACRMLMRPDDSPIHVVDVPIELANAIRLLLDGRKETGPEARLAPAIKTAGNGAPGAIAFWQITPGDTGAEEPQDTVEDTSVVSGGAACFWLLWRKQGL
jgi:hypothetical protein